MTPNTQPKILVLLLSGLVFYSTAQADSSKPSGKDDAVLDTVEVVAKPLSKDEKGEAQVYSKNVSNVYVGKEYLERYRVDSAGDILKGLNGVYNMNTRTAGSSITPNIRGIAGKGRIPVTIDGTEQTVDVWLNNYGVGDRNYVDPALFRSIAVEKSPSMTRGVKSGVGGAMSIRTIEADDIVPKGKKWGIQVKLGSGSNTIKPKIVLEDYLGKDYRTLPHNPSANGASGMVNGRVFSAVSFHGSNEDKPRTPPGGINDFKGDRSIFVAGAFKTDIVEGLLAYSDRRKGNYFSGKKGFEGYVNNPEYFLSYDKDNDKSSALIPNMAKLYRPGEEVINSNVNTETFLIKNKWHLPNQQTISLQYMNNDITFGELNPFYNALLLGYSSQFNMFPGKGKYEVVPGPTLSSKINSKTYKIGYSWKPENNRFIDLSANVWKVRTQSKRHQSGGPDISVAMGDFRHDSWISCNILHRVPSALGAYNKSCDELTQMGIIPKDKPPLDPPPIPGVYTTFSGSNQTTVATRSGFDISNRFRFRDNLSMTLSANSQYEKLDENNQIANNDKDLYNMMGASTAMTQIAGPRSGRRHEWGAQMVFDWQPTEKLSIQTGLRYEKFWAIDDGINQARQNKSHPFWAVGHGGGKVVDRGYIPYLEIMSSEQLNDFKTITNTTFNSVPEKHAAFSAYEKKWDIPSHAGDHILKFNTEGKSLTNLNDKGVMYTLKAHYPKYYNRKFHVAGLFKPGQFHEKAHNPQGQKGDYYRYLEPSTFSDPFKDYQEVLKIQKDLTDSGLRSGTYKIGFEERNVSEAEAWAPVNRIEGATWSPMFAISYNFTDNQRLFARYAQATRFPSIYETVGVSHIFTGQSAMSPEFNLKPERSINWEVGYGFNFAPYWSKLRHGDVRITYYSNTIKNVIDTGGSGEIMQYDKKLVKGIELQSRIDTGKYFASFGATYRLKQVTCDADLAASMDVYLNRVPACIEGGFGQSRFQQALQPQYSLNLDVGTRLLGEKLELGMRGIYHSSVKNKQYDQLRQQGLPSVYRFTGTPYRWRPSLILDAYANWNINKNFTMNVGVNNIGNRYYLDPMSNVPVPAPGRSISLGLTGKF